MHTTQLTVTSHDIDATGRAVYVIEGAAQPMQAIYSPFAPCAQLSTAGTTEAMTPQHVQFAAVEEAVKAYREKVGI